MIPRPHYLEQLISWKDQNIIKIITGVRRCGKSTLFELYHTELLKSGVGENQIQNINLEDPAYLELIDWKKLYDYINNRIVSNKKNYIFIDEIQNVKDFEKAADGLFIKKNIDLYLTGSNSKMQSGQWATLLSGRYVEIHMLPLSFKEYVSAYPYINTPETKYSRYLELSSFPYILEMIREKKSGDDIDIARARRQSMDYLNGIYNTIVLKDVVENKRITDPNRLETVIKYMADNIGSITSANNISNFMNSNGTKMDYSTVEGYLRAFCDSFIMYRADRYDIKGKKRLKTLNKYYLVDLGLRFMLLGDKRIDTGRILENIVYLELKRRSRNVYIGKVDIIKSKRDADTRKQTKHLITTEIDFVAESDNGTLYYQVAETVRDPKILERELRPLKAVKDYNQRFLLTMDNNPRISHDGIMQINVFDWLLWK